MTGRADGRYRDVGGLQLAACSVSGDGDEKTRVTAIVQKPPGEVSPGGGDCLVVIYTKEPTLLGKRFVLDMSPLRITRPASPRAPAWPHKRRAGRTVRFATIARRAAAATP